MDEFEMRRIICDYIKEICHYSQMQVFATSSYQSKYFQLQIDETTSGLINFFLTNSNNLNQHDHLQMQDQLIKQQTEQKAEQQTEQQAEQQMMLMQDNQQVQQVGQQQMQQPMEQQEGNLEITKEELVMNNGCEERPAYVAVNGTVYDMSQIIQWAAGTHFGLYAGKDLSSEFMICHKGMLEILQKLPVVGILKQ